MMRLGFDNYRIRRRRWVVIVDSQCYFPDGDVFDVRDPPRSKMRRGVREQWSVVNLKPCESRLARKMNKLSRN